MACMYIMYGQKTVHTQTSCLHFIQVENKKILTCITFKWIKGQKISWLGHLERMEEDRMPKKIFTQELEGTKQRGRPRKEWREEVERDLQVLGVRRWRELMTT